MNWQQTFLLQGSWKWAGILYCLGSLIHHCGPENWTQSSLGLFWYVSKQGSDQTFSFFFRHWSCGILFLHLLDSRSGLFSQYCSQRPFLIMFSALQHWLAALWGLYSIEERLTRSFTYMMQFLCCPCAAFLPCSSLSVSSQARVVSKWWCIWADVKACFVLTLISPSETKRLCRSFGCSLKHTSPDLFNIQVSDIFFPASEFMVYSGKICFECLLLHVTT